MVFYGFSCVSSGYNKGAFNLYSIEQEQKIGNDLAKQLLEEYQKKGQVYDDPQTLEYLNRMGQKLIQYAPEKDFQYHFYALKLPEVNAFAIPGGHIFVFTGLINYSQSEAELAGVLAHEQGHIIARHGTEQMSKQLAANIGASIVLQSVGGSVNPDVAGLAINIAATGYFLAYSRANEREADDLGARMIYKADWSPQGMVDFFDRLSKKEGKKSEIEIWLSTHPDPGDREQHVKQIMAQLGPKENLKMDSPEFGPIKAKISQIKYPEEKKKQ